MSHGTSTRIARVIQRVKQVWSELDHAQRRSFEVRTGIKLDDRPPSPRHQGTIDQLEEAYASGKWS